MRSNVMRIFLLVVTVLVFSVLISTSISADTGDKEWCPSGLTSCSTFYYYNILLRRTESCTECVFGNYVCVKCQSNSSWTCRPR